MEDLNREEIDKLRERQHELGNALQAQAAHSLRFETMMQNFSLKLDAIHGSIKEDLGEIKGKQDKTNGRVTELERKSARTDGGLAVMAMGLPVVTGLLVYVLIQLLSIN